MSVHVSRDHQGCGEAPRPSVRGAVRKIEQTWKGQSHGVIMLPDGRRVDYKRGMDYEGKIGYVLYKAPADGPAWLSTPSLSVDTCQSFDPGEDFHELAMRWAREYWKGAVAWRKRLVTGVRGPRDWLVRSGPPQRGRRWS